jgi:hypothetical protein
VVAPKLVSIAVVEVPGRRQDQLDPVASALGAEVGEHLGGELEAVSDQEYRELWSLALACPRRRDLLD